MSRQRTALLRRAYPHEEKKLLEFPPYAIDVVRREIRRGGKSGLATRAVDTHVSQVRKKLDLGPANGFRVVPVYHYGYRLEQTGAA